MKIHFLGTMGWFDSPLGNTLCVLLETGSAWVVFDAGGGFYKLDGYIKDKKPVILLLSHFHLDHILGLHALAKFKFPQGIKVFGPPGIKKLFGTIINAPYSMPVSKLGTRLEIKEFSNNLKLPVSISFSRLRHVSACYGYRVSAQGKSVAFCTDTGPCANLGVLAKGADALIAECSLPPGKSDKDWPHLNPQQAALAAKNGKVKRLFLVHFDAGVYTSKKKINQAASSARRIFNRTKIARDGQSVKL